MQNVMCRPFTLIFMESWPYFLRFAFPTNGNICQSHFSNVNEMDGAFTTTEKTQNEGKRGEQVVEEGV